MNFKTVFGLLMIGLALASCSSGGPPTKADIEKRFGFEIKDLSCVEAQGKPGYMCTFCPETVIT